MTFLAQSETPSLPALAAMALYSDGVTRARTVSLEVVKTERTVVTGMPDANQISTSHVEKQNHTLRMHCRRLTRLTNAFSKKFENFEAAVALNFAYYNFCKTHKAVFRICKAVVAGDFHELFSTSEAQLPQPALQFGR